MHHEVHIRSNPSSRRPPVAFVAVVVLLVGLPIAAFADDEAKAVGMAVQRTLVTSDIFTRVDDLSDEHFSYDDLTRGHLTQELEEDPNWLRANIRLAKKYGLEYRRSYSLKDRDTDIVLSVKGPMIRKRTAGLAFEIRF